MNEVDILYVLETKNLVKLGEAEYPVKLERWTLEEEANPVKLD